MQGELLTNPYNQYKCVFFPLNHWIVAMFDMVKLCKSRTICQHCMTHLVITAQC